MKNNEISITVSGVCAIGKSTVMEIISKALHEQGLNNTVEHLDVSRSTVQTRLDKSIQSLRDHNVSIKIVETSKQLQD